MPSNIVINQELCTACGICAAVCPLNILRQEGKEKAEVVEDSLRRCIACGHCEAYCPVNAIQAEYSGEYPLGPDLKTAFPDPAQLGHAMRSRRTCRVFKPDPVPRETVEEILDVARYAPSGSNRQPVHWVIIQTPERMARIGGLAVERMRQVVDSGQEHRYARFFAGVIRAYEQGTNIILRNAPHLAVTARVTDSAWSGTDATIAMAWFELAAQAHGVGTCWLGMLNMVEDSEDLMQEIGIPEGYTFVYAMLFGKPAFKPRQIPKRNPSRVIWR